MSHAALSALVSRAARAVQPPPTDGELLARFVAGDDAAFTDLVKRFGPMVLGVCRRVARDAHLADDAFQAAFVVLARRAAAVRPAEAVRGWLYGVAVRTAQEARTAAARRLAREVPVATVPERAAEPRGGPDADALRALDEEVSGLPDHLRAAVVLCELGGRSRNDAAEQLGVPAGTLSSRLAAARKRLAARLRARGFALPAAGLAAAAHAAVPPRLAAQAIHGALSASLTPAAVAALSNGVLRTMLFNKLILGAACAVVLAGVLAGVWYAPPPLAATEPPKPAPPPGRVDEAKPRPARAGDLLVCYESGPFRVLTPAGKAVHTLAPPKGTKPGYGGCLSPDGTRAAAVVMKEEEPRAEKGDEPWPSQVVVWTLGKEEPDAAFDLPADGLLVRWTADGKKLVAAKTTQRDAGVTFESSLLDPATGKAEKLDLPPGVRVLACGRDGKTFVVETFDPKGKPKSQVGLATLGKPDVTVLTKLSSGYPGEAIAALSPDGKTLLLIDADPARADANKWGCSQRVYRIDVRSKKREPLDGFPDNGQAHGVAWSPDGKKLAYCWKQLHADLLKKDTFSADDTVIETEAFVITADADGGNPKTVVSEKGNFAINPILGTIDWR